MAREIKASHKKENNKNNKNNNNNNYYQALTCAGAAGKKFSIAWLKTRNIKPRHG